MKTYVGMEAYIQIFLFSVLEVSGSAGPPRDSLNAAEKRVSYLCWKCKFDSTVVQPETYSLYRPQTISTQLSLSLSFNLGVLGVNMPVQFTKKCSLFWSSLHPPIHLFLRGDKFSLSCYTQRGRVCRLATWWIRSLLQLSCLSTLVQWDCIFFPFSPPLE